MFGIEVIGREAGGKGDMVIICEFEFVAKAGDFDANQRVENKYNGYGEPGN